jgi:small conductance mechanosensitive channel
MEESLPTNTFINKARTHGPKILISIGIFIFFLIIAFIVKKIITNSVNKKDVKNINNDKILKEILGSITYYIIIIIGLLCALVNAGFHLNSLLVIFGSIGLAVALAVQGSITQIVSGLMILWFKYFNIGDLIELNGNASYVSGFNLLNTTMTDAKNIKTIIPNNTIISGFFKNYSEHEKISIDVHFALSSNNHINYDILIENVRSEIIRKSIYCIDKESVLVRIHDISNSGTKLYARVLIKSIDFYPANAEINKIIRVTLANDNVLMLDNSYPLNSNSSS